MQVVAVEAKQALEGAQVKRRAGSEEPVPDGFGAFIG
jgi:hypothetical protein